MKMKHLHILILIALPIMVNAQTETSKKKEFADYYPNGKIKVMGKSFNHVIIDTLYTYYNDGELKTMQIFHGESYPRGVYYLANIRGSKAKKVDGFDLQTNDSTYIKEGVWKYYYKNGQVMDSVIYRNGIQIYRARFNMKGTFLFENK